MIDQCTVEIHIFQFAYCVSGPFLHQKAFKHSTVELGIKNNFGQPNFWFLKSGLFLF